MLSIKTLQLVKITGQNYSPSPLQVRSQSPSDYASGLVAERAGNFDR